MLDFEALERGATYDDGYTAQSAIVKWFWRVAHALTEEQKKRLLFFATGSDRVPIKGLHTLPFVLSKNGTGDDRLPSGALGGGADDACFVETRLLLLLCARREGGLVPWTVGGMRRARRRVAKASTMRAQRRHVARLPRSHEARTPASADTACFCRFTNSPAAHTCFNHLLMPEYSSEAVLKEKLLLAISNAEGFGLM